MAPPPPLAPAVDPAIAARQNAFKEMVKAEYPEAPGWPWVFILVAADLVIYGAGIAATIWWFPGSSKPGIASLAVADFAVGAVTFGMVIGWSKSMRTALAGSFFLVYLAFLGNIVISDFAKQLETDLGKNLVNILTASVTAIVGFYFAAKTTEQAIVVREAGKTARQV